MSVSSRPAAELKQPELVEKNVETTFRTAPFDSRFPTQNQATYCFQSFVDYHRCKKVKGDDYLPCEYFRRTYYSICPNHWIERYEEQVAQDKFPATF